MSKLVLPLVPVQDLDLQIHHLRQLREEKPRELALSDERRRKAQGNLEAIRDEERTLKLEISKREGEIKECDDRIQKLTVQSNQAKKNEEYQVMLKEISGVKAERGKIEDGLLDIYMRIDERRKLEAIRAEELAQVEREVGGEKKRIEAEIAELGGKLEALVAQRQERVRGVKDDVVKVYERILKAKDDGLALSRIETYESIEGEGRVVSFNCQGCHVGVNSQDVNRTMLGRDVVFCRACSRILYIEPVVDAGLSAAPTT